MKLKDIVFLEDYFFGKQLGINCLDFNKSSYFTKNDFCKNQFDYIGRFVRENEQQPQTFQNNISVFESEFETISTFEFLKTQIVEMILYTFIKLIYTQILRFF